MSSIDHDMIVLEGVCKSYDEGQTYAVDRLNLRVAAGELLVMLGESGCGKTTTLKMINRLIKPTSGRIEVEGQDTQQLDPVQLRRRMGYVFQGIGLFPHMTVGENVAVVPRLLEWDQQQIDQRVTELLDMVGLPADDYRDRQPDGLSGGQRQRVGLARALAAKPKLMLMDEPLGALDPLTRDTLQDEFTRIHRDQELTTVMVTHDMIEALLMGRPDRGDGWRADRPGGYAARAAHQSTARLRPSADGHAQTAGRSGRGLVGKGGPRVAMDNLSQQLELLPVNLANHLMITVIPLALGIGLSLSLAMFVVRRPSLRYPVLTTISVIQTVPSFALLALMVPVLAGFGALTSWAFGLELSALGFYPTVIALTMYSLLPVLRNTVTGILGVDPPLVEAARGMGMTPRQVLFKVELPLATPVIIAGIRTATVWVVGIATLATPVGQRCLGNYIFSGLQTRNWTAVLVGCIAAVILAIVLDLLIGGLEKAARHRRRSLGLICGLSLAVVFVGGLVAPGVIRATKPVAGSRQPVRNRLEDVYRAIHSVRPDQPDAPGCRFRYPPEAEPRLHHRVRRAGE